MQMKSIDSTTDFCMESLGLAFPNEIVAIIWGDITHLLLFE